MAQFSEKIKSIPGEFVLDQNLPLELFLKYFYVPLTSARQLFALIAQAHRCYQLIESSEVKILNSVKNLELAPKVLYQDESAGILIWEFIPGIKPGTDTCK